jgi:hypothetical protein
MTQEFALTFVLNLVACGALAAQPPSPAKAGQAMAASYEGLQWQTSSKANLGKTPGSR